MDSLNLRGQSSQLHHCMLCHRKCGVDRLAGERGYCGQDARIYAARAALHFWEEPCISGTGGSGAVFFSGCSMRCVFCQNHDIALGTRGLEITPARLSEIFLQLQNQGAHNINLVTPTHFIPQIVSALERAKSHGLTLPIVYNTGSYETSEALQMLDGLIDVYLPDFKYWDPQIAQRYANAPHYRKYASAAIAEMYRQVGDPQFIPLSSIPASDATAHLAADGTASRNKADRTDPDAPISGQSEADEASQSPYAASSSDGDADISESSLMTRGMIVRHLLLPGCSEDSMQILRYLHETYGNRIYISIMNQYTPVAPLSEYPELQRKVTDAEYDRVVDYCIDLGMEQAFIQDGEAAAESFIPEFNYTGLLT